MTHEKDRSVRVLDRPESAGSDAERRTIRAFHLGFVVLGLYAAAWLIVAWAVWE